MTEKLYEINSHMDKFNATVLSCEKPNNGYMVVLDKTAFFPEGGGQNADTGYLDKAAVTDVQIKNGIIVHYTDLPLTVGTSVNGRIDWKQRFIRMQNHSGEHIVSGIIHKKYGFNNVGFHMGNEDITLDIDGVLDREQLDEIEYEANLAVSKNIIVKTEYPSPKKLSALDYRSKLDITENVRIVTIDGYDMCACCAPHVKATGEIGIIKLLDFIHYKNGLRIHMLCGFSALADYKTKYRNNLEISNMLSSKRDETANAVARLLDENAKLKQEIHSLKKNYIKYKCTCIEPTDNNICVFEENMDMNTLREYANEIIQKCGNICAAFSGNDKDGYIYVILSRSIPLRALSKAINSAISGRGGGRDDILQGQSHAKRADIEKYFSDLKII